MGEEWRQVDGEGGAAEEDHRHGEGDRFDNLTNCKEQQRRARRSAELREQSTECALLLARICQFIITIAQQPKSMDTIPQLAVAVTMGQEQQSAECVLLLLLTRILQWSNASKVLTRPAEYAQQATRTYQHHTTDVKTAQ